jgi:uroporphyrinogen-III synthase
MGGQPLAGRSIVVTRPAGQADSLCAALTALGAEPLRFPLLTIAPVADPAPLQAMARRLADFSLAFFVSPNAVRLALDAMLPVAPWPAGWWPPSARAARRRWPPGLCRRHRAFSGFDSESVLALPAFQAARWPAGGC